MLVPLREEQAPEAISFQGRGNKHGEEWYHARTDDQKIETADDKMLCPDGIYLWFPKENINDGQKKKYNSPMLFNSPWKLEMHRQYGTYCLIFKRSVL